MAKKKYLLIFNIHIVDDEDSSESGDGSAERTVECEPEELPRIIAEKKKQLESKMTSVGHNMDVHGTISLTQVLPLE